MPRTKHEILSLCTAAQVKALRRAAAERQWRPWWPAGANSLASSTLLTPNERRVAEDRPDCYWRYVVTSCDNEPRLQEPIRDPARLDWHEVTKVAHYYLSVDAMTKPMLVREDSPPYGEKE